jgi:hypothetical protein
MNKPFLPTLPTSPTLPTLPTLPTCTLPTLPTFQISLKHRTLDKTPRDVGKGVQGIGMDSSAKQGPLGV